MRKTTALAMLCYITALVGCGGTPPASSSLAAASGEQAGAPSWSDRAVTSYLEGDMDAAWRASQNALQLNPLDDHGMEVAARVALSRLDARATVAVLERAHGPTLLRLRARANAMLGEFAAVARDLGAVDGQEPVDGWATAMLPLSRAATAGPYFSATGDASAEIPYQGAAATLPIPIVAITIDGHATNALIATSASTTVVDDDGHPSGSVIADIGLGALHVHNVPSFARDLSDIENAVHIPIGAVIGMDILLHLHATLDGPNRKLIVRTAAPEIANDSLALPFAMFQGSLLAIRATINDGQPQYYALDSAAGLVLALADVAVQSMHVDPATLPLVPGSPVANARVVDIESFHLGAAAIEHVPGVTGLVPPGLVEVAGTRIYGVIGGQFLAQFQMTFDTESNAVALRIDNSATADAE
jgi:hypothetical protein